MHPTEEIEIFGTVSMPLVRWPSIDIRVKFYGDHPRGIPPSGELNTRGVAEYSDFDLSNAISRKRCKIKATLVLNSLIGSRI